MSGGLVLLADVVGIAQGWCLAWLSDDTPRLIDKLSRSNYRADRRAEVKL